MQRPGQTRPSRFEDYDGWHALWLEYLDFYGVRLAPGVDEATWRRLHLDGADHRCLLHENDAGAIDGFAVYLFHRSSWTDTWNCLLEDLYVACPARGRGAGRALLEGVFAHADRRRCYRVYWHTDRDNQAARALYDRVARVADVVQYRR